MLINDYNYVIEIKNLPWPRLVVVYMKAVRIEIKNLSYNESK